MDTWNYSVSTDQGAFTGVLNFTKKEGKLAGEVVSSDGQSWTMDSLELKDGNTVNFEIRPEAETFKSTLKFKGDSFKGMTGPPHTQFEVSGEKHTK